MNFSLNRGTLVVPTATLSVHQEENGNVHVHTNKTSTDRARMEPLQPCEACHDQEVISSPEELM